MDSPAPVPLQYASPPSVRPARPLALLAFGLAAVVAGTLVGTSTNAVNAAVSPTYFINVMGWQYVSNVWLASIYQGIFEGSIVGLVLSAILTTTVGIITKATCTCGMGLRFLAIVILATYCTWAIGGICGVALAAASPTFFRNTFIGVPGDPGQLLRFAWVGGSIWGAEGGGLVVVIIALVVFRIRWRKMLQREGGGVFP